MNADSVKSANGPHGGGPHRASNRRRLYRSSDDRIISGVAGGIAEYFDIDAVIVRIALVVLTLAGGAGFIGYIAAWVLLPERDGSVAWMGHASGSEGRRRPGRADARQLGAIALVGLGAVMLLDRIGIGIDGGIAWPVALIGGGAAVLWGQRNRDDDATNGPDGPSATFGSGPVGGSGNVDGTGDVDGPSGPSGPGGPSGFGGDGFGGPAGGGPSAGGVATAVSPSTELVVVAHEGIVASPVEPRPSTAWSGEARHAAATGAGIGDATHIPQVDASNQTRSTDRARRRADRASRRAGRAGRTPFARAALGLFVALVGIVLLAARLGAFDDRSDRQVDGALAMMLIAVGGVLTIGAWLGRPRGFILVGLLTGAALIASATFDVSWSGGFGERSFRPTNATLQPAYRLTAGQLHVDLSDVDMRNQRVRVAGEVSLGQLLIEVPADVNVVVTAKAAAGETVLFGNSEDGPTIDRTRTESGTSEGAGTLYIDARVGLGQLEVARAGQLINDDAGSGTDTNLDSNNSKNNRSAR